MFNLVNPYVSFTLFILIVGIGGYEHHAGYQARVKEDEAEIARLNDEARAKEQQVAQKFSQINSQLKKAKDEIKTKQISINTRIDSGELRLPSQCPVHTSTDPSSGDGDKGGESDRQAIKDIVAITSDGDSAIKDLNACISKYNEVRDKFNKVVK